MIDPRYFHRQPNPVDVARGAQALLGPIINLIGSGVGALAGPAFMAGERYFGGSPLTASIKTWSDIDSEEQTAANGISALDRYVNEVAPPSGQANDPGAIASRAQYFRDNPDQQPGLPLPYLSGSKPMADARKYLQASSAQPKSADAAANLLANRLVPPSAQAVDAPFPNNPDDALGGPTEARQQYFADHTDQSPGPDAPYSGGKADLSAYLRNSQSAMDQYLQKAQIRAANRAPGAERVSPTEDAQAKKYRDVLAGAGIPPDELLGATNVWTKSSTDSASGSGDAGRSVDANNADVLAAQTPNGYREWKPSFPIGSDGKTPKANMTDVIQAYRALKSRSASVPAANPAATTPPTDSAPATTSAPIGSVGTKGGVKYVKTASGWVPQ